jgi:hypothetical protein
VSAAIALVKKNSRQRQPILKSGTTLSNSEQLSFKASQSTDLTLRLFHALENDFNPRQRPDRKTSDSILIPKNRQ